MTSNLKIQITALAAMVGIGVAAPLGAWMVLRPDVTRAVAAHGVMAQPIALGALEAPAPPAAGWVITLDEVNVELPAAVRVVDSAKRMQRCTWHQSQTLAEGRVRVCDYRDRTTIDAPRRLLEPSKKPTRLAPRDVPSPTGLFAARERR